MVLLFKAEMQNLQLSQLHIQSIEVSQCQRKFQGATTKSTRKGGKVGKHLLWTLNIASSVYMVYIVLLASDDVCRSQVV